MLLVRTTVGPSEVHGLGLFAAEPIITGQRVWEFNPSIDREISLAEIERLPAVAREWVLLHSYADHGGRLILSADSGIYFNHSDDPNTEDRPGGAIALRNIAIGEEMTKDYRRLGRGGCNAFLFER
jgi:SET domain-containing protein